jgi:hypothetical protein
MFGRATNWVKCHDLTTKYIAIIVTMILLIQLRGGCY